MKPVRLLLLASGRGSHAVNLIEATRDGRIVGTVVSVVSDRAAAPVLPKARALGAATEWLSPEQPGPRLAPAAQEQLLGIVGRERPNLIALCGFMKLLSGSFLARVGVPILNVHPSLLPRFRGLNAQRQAIEAGVAETGATVHFVDAGMDTGPIYMQVSLAIRPSETAEELAERLLPLEHRLYVEAIRRLQQEWT